MDAKNAFEAIVAIRNTVPPEELLALDSKLVAQFGLVAEATGTVAVAETLVTATPEAPTITSESLLATLDTALTTYSSLLDVVNGARAEVKGRKKPAQLEVADHNAIRAEVEALAANPAILADLQAQADYFTANPEKDSPAVGFDIVVIPEGLTDTDEQAVATDLQGKLNTLTGENWNPYIRDARYNDKRTPEVTDKGYRIAFAPKHYNIPAKTTVEQTKWMQAANQETTATQLVTANDGEAMAQISNLLTDGELNDSNTRYHNSYYRRFDQQPVDGFVSLVLVYGDGGFYLGESGVGYDYSTRALVVPKLNA